jgi:predicted Zn-dependent protease
MMNPSTIEKTACCLVLLLAVILANSCQTMEPALNVGAALGVSSGVVTQSQANSIVRGATAVGKTFQDFTPEQEYYIGRSVAATVLQRYRPYDNEEANRYVNTLGQTLAQASDMPETYGGYHFLILDSDEVNAFAAPGGLILVTRGMLRLCKDEGQVAAVLAHEIGHVQGRHGLRAIKTSRVTAAFTVLAAESAKNLGGAQVAQLTEAFEGSVADITSMLVNNGYSRDLEREADFAAVMILGRVGYAPASLTGLLNEMDKRMPRGGAGFAKTHPDPKDRIQGLSAQAGASAGMPATPERKARFSRFMAKV